MALATASKTMEFIMKIPVSRVLSPLPNQTLLMRALGPRHLISVFHNIWNKLRLKFRLSGCFSL